MAANPNSFITLANLQNYNNNLKVAFGLTGDEKFDEVRALIDASFKAIEYEEVKDDEDKITSRVLKFYRLTEAEISEKRTAGETVNPDYEITLPGDVVIPEVEIPDPVNGTADDKDKIVIVGENGKALAISDFTIDALKAALAVTVEKEDGKYVVKQGGTAVETSIDIVKDSFLENAQLVAAGEGADADTYPAENGPYLKFVFNTIENGQPSHETIYVSVKDLVDVYTGTDPGANGIKITVNDDNTISATLQGEIATDNLPEALRDQLNNDSVNGDIDSWF